MPVAPGNKGQRQFLHDISDEMRHTFRRQLVDVTKDDLLAVTDQ